MARRHHIQSGEDLYFTSIAGSDGDPNKCSFYIYYSGNTTVNIHLYKTGGYGSSNIVLEISTDGNTWTEWTADSSGNRVASIPNRILYIRNKSKTPTFFSDSTATYTFADFDLSERNVYYVIGGNIQSLLCACYNRNIPATAYCFSQLFMLLTIAPVQWIDMPTGQTHSNLVMPFTTLAPMCFNAMFLGCTHNTTYRSFNLAGSFSGTSDQNVLVLQGDMTGATGCFSSMFATANYFIGENNNHDKVGWIKMHGITGTMPQSAFDSMFYQCTNLTYTYSVLCGLDWYFGDHGIIAQEGMLNMFNGCTNLIRILEWEGNSEAPLRYNDQYYYEEPDLDDVRMDIYTSYVTSGGTQTKSYIGSSGMNCMFYGCTSLWYAFLPSHAVVGDYSCAGMYNGCTGLLGIIKFHGDPILPAGINYTRSGWNSRLVINTLGQFCYSTMFEDCSNLQETPILPAPADNQSAGCYFEMFRGCTNIHYIKMLGTASGSYTYNWLYNTNNDGVMVIAGSEASATRGQDTWTDTSVNGSNGWTVFNTYNEPFWILNPTDGAITVRWIKNGSAPTIYIYNSVAGSSGWDPTSPTTRSSTWTVSIPAHRRMFFSSGTSNTNAKFGSGTSNYWNIYIPTGADASVGGNLFTLLKVGNIMNMGTAFSVSYGFFKLLASPTSGSYTNAGLKYAQDLNICGKQAIDDSGSLTGSFTYTFRNFMDYQTNLLYPPQLIGPKLFYSSGSTTIKGVFRSAFIGCNNLVETPIMYMGNITKVQHLLWMFCIDENNGHLRRATFLNNALYDASSSSDPDSATYNWMYGQPASATFYISNEQTWDSSITRNNHTIPPGWTINKQVCAANFHYYEPNKIYYLENKYLVQEGV